MPSNPDEDESEGMKETVTEQKTKMGAKNEEAGIAETGFSPSDQDEEESEELKLSVMEQDNELGTKNEEAGKPETRSVQARCIHHLIQMQTN